MATPETALLPSHLDNQERFRTSVTVVVNNPRKDIGGQRPKRVCLNWLTGGIEIVTRTNR